MISLEDLSIGYGGRRGPSTVGENLTAYMPDGTLTCLVGVNGIGKSTLVRTIAGFLPPVSGQVLVGKAGSAKSVTSMSGAELARITGVVLTTHSEMADLSVWDVVSFGRTPYTGIMGTLSDEDCEAIETAIQMVGIDSLVRRNADDLSDGERQKVMIAKALAQQTPVIILDEPSAFLDYPSKEELMRILRRLAHDEGKTVLLSSHDLDIVRRYADMFWIMERKDGSVIMRSSDTLHADPFF